MSVIDSSEWSEFNVSQLFERVERGKGSGARSFMDGDVPYIAASFVGNGHVRGVDDKDGSLTSDGNAIALICNGNGGVGRNTYQPEPFVGSSDLLIGYHSRLNQWTGLFLVACLDKSIERYNYSFAWKRNGDAFKQETVFLPADSTGSPDWDYMEGCIRRVMKRQEQELGALVAIGSSPQPVIDISSWREFRVGDLFHIRPTKAYKAINAQLFSETGQSPVVVNSAQNNGVGGFTDRETTEVGGTITFSDTTTWEAVFYQPKDFVGYPHVQGMYPKEPYANMWRENQLLFFVSVFRKAAFLRGFSYGDKFTREIALTLRVPLPSTATGSPDWDLMEQMMLDVTVGRLEALQHLLPISS